MAKKELYTVWSTDSEVYSSGPDSWVVYYATVHEFDTTTRTVSAYPLSQRVYLTPVADTPPNDYSLPTDEELAFFVVNGIRYGYFHDGTGNVTAVAQTICDLAIAEVRFTGRGAGFDLIVVFSTTAGNKQARVSLSSFADASAPWLYSGEIVTTVPAGTTGTVYLTDRHECQQKLAFTAPAAVVYGCMDPEADNYNPAATSQPQNACTYTQRLSVEGAASLVPNGSPVLVTLRSATLPGTGLGQLPVAPTGGVVDDVNNTFTFTPAPGLSIDDYEFSLEAEPVATQTGEPAPASAVITVPPVLTDGLRLAVNGFAFVSGPYTNPERFSDAATLLEALRSVLELAGAYELSLPTPTTVRLVARTEGTAGNLTITYDAPLAVETVSGTDRYYSQKRVGFGVFLELWGGCGRDYQGVTDKKAAQLIATYESRYRSDNAYVFDLAEALRELTGHALPAADGTCADRLNSYFLRYGEVYASEAGQLRHRQSSYETAVLWTIEAVELVGEYLSTRPVPRRVPVGSQAMQSVLRAGGVRQVAYTGTTRPAQVGDVLRFVNRQGGFEAVVFEGVQEEALKIDRSTYGAEKGIRNRAIDVTRPVKLYSALLDKPTWAWLQVELGSSPSAWLQTEAGPVEMTVSDLDAAGDVLKNEYSLTVELTPTLVFGLTN